MSLLFIILIHKSRGIHFLVKLLEINYSWKSHLCSLLPFYPQRRNNMLRQKRIFCVTHITLKMCFSFKLIANVLVWQEGGPCSISYKIFRETNSKRILFLVRRIYIYSCWNFLYMWWDWESHLIRKESSFLKLVRL